MCVLPKFICSIVVLQKDPERQTELLENLQSLSLTPVRNPFKVKIKQDKAPERRRDPDAEKDRGEINDENKHVNGECCDSAKKKDERNKTTEREGNNKKGPAGQSDTEKRDSADSESWRNKKLPAGMKIKKIVSDDEKPKSTAEDETCPESSNPVKENDKGQTESENNLKDQQEQSPRKSGGSVQSPSKSSSGLNKKTSNKQSTSNSKSGSDKTQSQSPSCSTPQNGTVSEKPTALDVQKTEPNQSKKKDQRGIARFGEWSDEDDDVQLISVQPPTQQSAPTPAALVQKTLTSYPGFQNASIVQGQSEDPRALHSQLTAQLKQKKVTRSLMLSCISQHLD